jgi:penicillin-binding protein 2
VEGVNNRTIIIGAFLGLVGVVFIFRLFMLQVYDPSYKYSAESNTRRKITEYPSRGLIYDRNGKLLVSNQAVYDVMVVPREVVPFDTAEFCQCLGVSREKVDELFLELYEKLKTPQISSYKASVFFKQLSAEQYGVFQEKLYKFKGFFGQRRILRKYEYPNAAHVLGYVGEIGDGELKKEPYYSRGDYWGISGVEQSYESFLRGSKGSSYVLVDVHGREKGAFHDGKIDAPATSGKDLMLTLDMELQAYGEQLMQNKTGSIVAIDPATGEILAMVSAPTYDPSLLVGRERNNNFPVLASDTLFPMLNRAIMSGYPPGSTFKTLMALIGQQEGVLFPNTLYSCQMGYHARGLSVGCHSHRSPLDLVSSIKMSCNSYYCNVLRSVLDNPVYGSSKVGLDKWKDYLVKFGFGYRLGTDFSSENRGFVPNSRYYDRIYDGRWSSLTVISLAIGQGELLTTPLQMANMTAAIANRGYWIVPHVLKEVENDTIPSRFKKKQDVGINKEFFAPVIEGMEQAVWGGEGSTAGIARIKGISICGKTGTAQNPHGDDHSIFISFAPKDDPKIVVATIVENGSFGATYGAPVSSLMIEYYLNRQISGERKWIEKRMLEADLIHEKRQ